MNLESIKPVTELTNITSKDISGALLSSETPLLFKGACSHWPIVQKAIQSNEAAAQHLLSHYTGEPINAFYGEPEINGRVFYNQNMDGFNVNAHQIPLQLVIEKLLSCQNDAKAPTVYMGSTNTARWFPTLENEHDFTLANASPLTSVWLGNQSKIAAHFDFPTNLACNLAGKRRFLLFPPEQIENLYVGPLEFAPGGQAISLVDFENPDFNQFPKFAEALEHALIAELSPGDILLLPSMWWHQVEAKTGFNLLLTHWWRDTSAFYGRPDNALELAILSLRSLPKAQRKAWQALFNYYVFNDELDSLEHIPEHAKAALTLPLPEQQALKLRASLLNKLKR